MRRFAQALAKVIGTLFPRSSRAWRRRAPAALLCALAPLLLAGCPEQRGHDDVANQSLVEIGELSLEEGERLEGEGRARDANVAYRRALWAFRYHERLTREEPLLMDDALAGIRRTSGQGGR